MAVEIDYEKAKAKLARLFKTAEEEPSPSATANFAAKADLLFKSSTQSIREVALGCGLVKIMQPDVDLTLPYVEHGAKAYSGRTFDELVVNPFFHDKAIPCSKGPYLASFRRSVKFIPETANGLRDKDAYFAFLSILATITRASPKEAKDIVVYLLKQFIKLRDASIIQVAKIERMSLGQIRSLISRLLGEKSGGLVPVLCTVAILETLRICYDRQWEISYQGINVSDKASGAGGDVTVIEDGRIVLSLEVTERPIEKARIVSTFKTKIALGGIREYLFIYSGNAPEDEARSAAERYYSQGHEINFLHVQEWIGNVLGTVGAKCRRQFLEQLTKLFDSSIVPARLKVAWNEHVQAIVSM